MNVDFNPQKQIKSFYLLGSSSRWEYHSVKEWDGSISEKCYKFVVEELTWKEAQKSCQKASNNMVFIKIKMLQLSETFMFMYSLFFH